MNYEQKEKMLELLSRKYVYLNSDISSFVIGKNSDLVAYTKKKISPDRVEKIKNDASPCTLRFERAVVLK